MHLRIKIYNLLTKNMHFSCKKKNVYYKNYLCTNKLPMVNLLFTLANLLLFLYLLKKNLQRKKAKKMKKFKGEQVLNILINTDANMQKGKIISQACHAVAGTIRQSDNEDWERGGEAKIVLKATYDEMCECIEIAKKNDIPYYRVYDAGRTQVAAGTNTAVAIGPAPKELMTRVTGHLKLF